MRYKRDLQVRLQERYRRLYKANALLHKNEAGYLVTFIRETPALRYIIDDVERSESLDPATWISDNFGHNKADWPSTEVGRAKVSWYLLQQWAAIDHGAAMFGIMLNPSDRHFNSGAHKATETVVEPLIEFLQERIGEASDVLYLLERYVRKVEWFEKESLFERFRKDTARGEAIYDRDLRQFLFEQGIDFPFSQPRSASGQSDVVANLEGDDPLVCEIKLFDGDHYSKTHLAKGVHQATIYARDYGKTSGYLVVFNLSTQVLQLPSEGPADEWPPRIDVGGIIIFLVQVRALPQPSASTRGAAQLVAVSRDDLLRLAD